MSNWDHSFDVVIAGSGGGGLVAALVAHDRGLRPVVLEKSEYFGGSTALSAGAVWIPKNPLMQREGVEDSEEKARAYLDAAVGDTSAPARRRAYVTNGPEMLAFLEEKTCAEFQRIPGFSDYFAELPGGVAAGRSVEPVPFDGRRLGEWRKALNPPLWPMMAMFPFTGKEYVKMLMMRSNWMGKKTLLAITRRVIVDLFTGRRTLTMGQALVGMMAASVKERGIPLWLGTGIKDLVVEDDVVVGVVARQHGRDLRVRAERGVLLATGGFARNQQMRDGYMKQPSRADWSLASKADQGDGIQIGFEHGADSDLMDDAWWGPVSLLPDHTAFFHVSERSQPGSLIVNKEGVRFTNEAQPYSELGHVIYEKNAERTGSTIPCYFIMDRRFRRKYIFGLNPPGITARRDLSSGYIVKARTIGELARKLELPAEVLERTIEEYNRMAEAGKDTAFGKGDGVYDRYYGDPTVAPNPCMYPLKTPPFYCVKLYPGDLGTKGGLVTNEKAQVLRKDGSVIEGLYATGNTAASVMGRSYPGPGATVGASMVFGYVAANEIARQQVDEVSDFTVKAVRATM